MWQNPTGAENECCTESMFGLRVKQGPAEHRSFGASMCEQKVHDSAPGLRIRTSRDICENVIVQLSPCVFLSGVTCVRVRACRKVAAVRCFKEHKSRSLRL